MATAAIFALLQCEFATCKDVTESYRIVVPFDRIASDDPSARRFIRWVNRALAGERGYAFSATDAAAAWRLTGSKKYCDLAIKITDEIISAAEQAISTGRKPEISGDSYLHVGPTIRDIATTFDWCGRFATAIQMSKWRLFAEQAVWNTWNHKEAVWGKKAYPWSGWATDNPGNNYYFSFIEATMYLALATNDSKLLNELRAMKLPLLSRYYSTLVGGGSLEGTAYGLAQQRLFELAVLWRDSTGEHLPGIEEHATATISYWIHATVPTRDAVAPIGDQSRYSFPEIYDYHRNVLIQASRLTTDKDAKAMAVWWLGEIALRKMADGFNFRHDIWAPDGVAMQPTLLFYHASGVGNMFARTSWKEDALWLSFVGGPFIESHAHQEQGAVNIFQGRFLTSTENIYTRSGIRGDTDIQNVLRFESNGKVITQKRGRRVRARAQDLGEQGILLSAVLTSAYGKSSGVRRWSRRALLASDNVTITDDYEVDQGTKAVFQMNVVDRPIITGSTIVAGSTRIQIVSPKAPIVDVLDWRSIDSSEFLRGFRIDITGSDGSFVVEVARK